VNLRKYFLSLLLLLPFYSNGQDNVTHEWFYWVRFYSQFKFIKPYTLHAEIDTRRYFTDSKQSQFFTHIHVHRRLKPWLDVALGFNYNFTQLPTDPKLKVPELRPWQEFTILSRNKSKWPLLFRYRLDERFIHNNNKVELTEGYHFNLRHRFRVGVSTELVSFKNNSNLTLRFYDEVMINTGDVPRAFDQNRLSASLEYQFNKKWSIESGYINILQPKTDTEYYDRHIIRTTLYYRLEQGIQSAD
jgi:Protein of unknown function (DUF2490)